MAIGDDFSVAVNGDIRWTGTTATYTVLEFHRWLQDLADNASTAGDDLLDITDDTPSDRSTDNIITLQNSYNITDTEAEHLYDGSITQDNGDTVFAGLVVVGTVESGTELQIVQDGALLTNYWGTGLNADAGNNILLRLCVKTRENGADIDGRRLLIQSRELGDTYSEFSVTMGLGNNTAAIFTGQDLNNPTAAGTIATYDQFSNTEGYQLLDITGDAVNEPYYSQWTVDDGGTTPASPNINDLYEYTKWTQRRGTAETLHGINGELFRGITHDITYDTLTGTFTENNYLIWGTEFAYDAELTSGLTVGEYYTFNTSGAVGKLIGLDDNGTTGYCVFSIEPGSGTVVDNETFTRADGTADDGATVDGATKLVDTGAVGGEALILADEGSTNIYVQLLTGAPPVDNLPIHDATTAGVYNEATNDALVNVTVTPRTISPEFIGTSTGSALIGAYGIAVDPVDTTSSDQFFDLDNTLRVPPNNVTFTVSGLVSGEDRVLVAPETAGGIDVAQLTLNTTLSGAAETAVVATAAIPSDTPSSGTIRIQLDDDTYRLQSYTSFTSATFTIPSSDYSVDSATQPRNIFISYIDKLAAATSESFTVVYNADRALFIRVRSGSTPGSEIKTFETTGTLGSGGGGTTAIRTDDS